MFSYFTERAAEGAPETTSELPLRRRDAFQLDPWLTSKAPPFDQLLAHVIARLRKEAAVARWREERTANLRMLLANLFVADHRQPGKPVKYYRRASAYSANSIYQPAWLSAKVLGSVVDDLARLGWADSQVGRWDVFGEQGFTSTVATTDALSALFSEFGLSRPMIDKDAAAPLVELRSVRGPGRRFSLIEPAPTGTLAGNVYRDASDELETYNTFIKGFSVWVPDDCRGAMSESDESMQAESWFDLCDTRLHRIFVNVDLETRAPEYHGRFYGGWWQSIRKECRPEILIDGETTVELDYSGCHPRMIYHRSGLAFDRDPYDIPALTAAVREFERPKLRGAVKVVMNSLINGTNRQIAAAARAKVEELERRWEIELPRDVPLATMVRLIREHHQPISDSFGIGLGLTLQYEDAELCGKILAEGVRADIPILPVHDSFIVRRRDRDQLRSLMILIYENRFGFTPSIREAQENRDRIRSDISSLNPNKEELFNKLISYPYNGIYYH